MNHDFRIKLLTSFHPMVLVVTLSLPLEGKSTNGASKAPEEPAPKYKSWSPNREGQLLVVNARI